MALHTIIIRTALAIVLVGNLHQAESETITAATPSTSECSQVAPGPNTVEFVYKAHGLPAGTRISRQCYDQIIAARDAKNSLALHQCVADGYEKTLCVALNEINDCVEDGYNRDRCTEIVAQHYGFATVAAPRAPSASSWNIVVCSIRPCGALPDDGRGRNSYLVLQSFPTEDPERKCDTKIYGNSGCHLYHKKAIGNGWTEIVP